MRMLRPAGYLANRAAGRWVFDALVTVAAAALTLATPIHERHHTGPAAFIVLAVIVAPLVVRRIWPIQVFGWILVTGIPAALWNKHLIAWPALLIALYTVAALRSRQAALVCAGLFEIATVVGLALLARNTVPGWWFFAIPYTGMIAAALGLGLYSATRRAYLAELHDRADRLERERDQQGALAAAAERARIAREMHDVVAHHLTVMVTLSEAAAASATSPERAAEVMRSVSATGRRALADTRRLLGVLRQHPGDDPAVALAPVPDLAQLDALIEEVRSAGLQTTLEVCGQAPDVPAGVQLTVYRLVQEALTNTLKHGGTGARATVRLRYLPGELQVDMLDLGVFQQLLDPVLLGRVGRHQVGAVAGQIRSETTSASRAVFPEPASSAGTPGRYYHLAPGTRRSPSSPCQRQRHGTAADRTDPPAAPARHHRTPSQRRLIKWPGGRWPV